MYSMKTNTIYCGDCAEVLRYFPQGSWEEVARAKQEEGLEIELKTVEELLKET